MKKYLLFIIVAVCAITSCGKKEINVSSSNFLPGTTWGNTDGNIVSFTKSSISYDGATASYSIIASSEKIAVYFAIDDLKVGEKTFVSGMAYETQQQLTLTYQINGRQTMEYFTLMK